MGTLAKSKDPIWPDEIPTNVAFHQGLHCLLNQNRFSEEKTTISFGKYSLIYTMDHLDFIVCSSLEKTIGLKKVNPLYIYI